MENFNDKVWYRLLKVIFIIAFVFFQVVSCIIVFEIYGTKEIAPQSFQEVGKLVKYVYGEYLADEYLFEIDKDIFLNGRIIPDLDIILVAQIRDEIENADRNYFIVSYHF